MPTCLSACLHTPPLAPVRTIAWSRPLVWLSRALQDISNAPLISLAHGLALILIGAAILTLGHNRFWLMAGALSGFLVVGPLVATSLYAVSRAMERGEVADWGLIRRTWTQWQSCHATGRGGYWCMVRFGALLALAATGWVVTSAALITLLAPVPIETPRDFLLHVVLADEGWLFELWLALGSLMAAPIFLSSVVAMPLLLDRRASLRQAILTSWLAVLANPLPMALWAALILGFTLLGLGSLLLGMIAVMPMLGHASWHAYRDLVDASSLPLRESVHATPTQGGRP